MGERMTVRKEDWIQRSSQQSTSLCDMMGVDGRRPSGVAKLAEAIQKLQ
jgi:hypothetical protein